MNEELFPLIPLPIKEADLPYQLGKVKKLVGFH